VPRPGEPISRQNTPTHHERATAQRAAETAAAVTVRQTKPGRQATTRGEGDGRQFRDRAEAGRILASRLTKYAGRPGVLVLGLPRGGLPVAFEVAQALKAPLDVFLVRKLGVPGQEELAMGAIATGGVRVLNADVVRALGIANEVIDAVAAQEQRELERREQAYRDNRPAPQMRSRTVILIDDGLATGSTMRAAISALRQQAPARIIVAVPVGAAETCAELHDEADEFICARIPEPFYAVGLWYRNFSQTTDEEVHELLEKALEDHARNMPRPSENGRPNNSYRENHHGRNQSDTHL
jgi:predicted phosphoribosyltransferase